MTKKVNRLRHLKGALLGFGKMAEHGHLPGWRAQPGASIEAVCDPDPERRRRASELLPRARTYASPEELYRTEPLDFVDICTPPPLHAPMMTGALERGLHVLCEKPFVGSRREFGRVLRLVAARQRVAFPAHNWKHAPILARARQWLERGLLGKTLYSEFHTLRMHPALGHTQWRGEKKEAGGGGILLDHGWHGMYLLLLFHQERPLSVSAWTDPAAGADGCAEESAHLQLEFPHATGNLFLTWKAPGRYNSARVYGEKGMLLLEDDRLSFRGSGRQARSAVFGSPLSQGSHHPDWTAGLLKDFLEAIASPHKALGALEEAFLCLEITLLAYASSRRAGRRMSIPRWSGLAKNPFAGLSGVEGSC
ncbi:MAG: Gfo/Idh/MocA family oxidoreductase [bacterium]